ncbi:hypothetical protein [Pedobacter sp. SYSU D00535]|uniref:hypothetical protein n=1 Tax=Pedobacter sp. SYSU D00535 TaxID=2810308 RepID=UPI001A97C303|nr:hypothetical protein [Pedobacter sp. SYSU D00535]
MNQSPTIEKVLSSKTFANKEVLKGLLRFLYAESVRGQSLKEMDIAVAYFNRRAEFIASDDTIVRVNIYKLRTLLEKYYAEEGKEDAELVEIPKGSYTVLIHQRNRGGEKKKAIQRLPLVLGSLFLLSLLANLYLFTAQRSKTVENPVWNAYVESAQPVSITLGDPFFFRVQDQHSAAGNLIVRDITVNSKEDLELAKPVGLQEIKSEVSELNYPYFSRNNLWPLPDLISFFAKSSVETRLQTLSESNIDDIKNSNVIFIANINSFGWMNKFLEKTSLRIATNPRTISIRQDGQEKKLTVPEYIKGSYVDYALLVKIPGPNNNLITLMGDFHASGLRGLTSYISKPATAAKLRQQVEERYGEFPAYFEMVVKVTSYNYSDFDTELIHFKPVQ